MKGTNSYLRLRVNFQMPYLWVGLYSTFQTASIWTSDFFVALGYLSSEYREWFSRTALFFYFIFCFRSKLHFNVIQLQERWAGRGEGIKRSLITLEGTRDTRPPCTPRSSHHCSWRPLLNKLQFLTILSNTGGRVWGQWGGQNSDTHPPSLRSAELGGMASLGLPNHILCR